MRKRSEATKKPKPKEPEAEAPKTQKRKPYEWRSVNEARRSELREDMEKIVETVWVNEMDQVWKRVRESLKVGEKRSEHGFLHKALDDARETSYNAHRLYITAKREHDRWELENEVIFSAMWNDASRALESERSAPKEVGIIKRTKPITDTDVRSKIMTLHPDEYIAQETKRKKVKLTLESLTQLAKEAFEHVEDLRILLTKLRS